MKLIYIPNIFEKADRQEREVEFTYQTVKEHLKTFEGADFKDLKCIIGGKLVEWDYKPSINDTEVLFVQHVQGKFLGVIAGSIVTVLGLWIPGLMPIGIGMLVGGVVGLVYSYLFTPDEVGKDGFKNSATYSFDGIQNLIGEGNVVPVVYGRHRMGGAVIEGFIDGNTSAGLQLFKYANVLLAMSEGPVVGIDTKSIKLDQNNISDYTHINKWTKLGESAQTAIGNFSKVKRHYTMTSNIKIVAGSENAYIYTTFGAIDSARVVLYCPAMYVMSDKGDMGYNYVTMKVYIAPVGSSEFTLLHNGPIANKTKNQFEFDVPVTFPSNGEWKIKIERVTPDFIDPQYAGDIYLKAVTEIENAYCTYPYTALLGIRALATNKLSGKMPNITAVLFGRDVADVNGYVVSSTNLVANGTFSADTDWTKGTNWTIADGVAKFRESDRATLLTRWAAWIAAAFYQYNLYNNDEWTYKATAETPASMYQAGVLTKGKWYKVTYEIKVHDFGKVRVRAGDYNDDKCWGEWRRAVGVHTEYIYCDYLSTNTNFYIDGDAFFIGHIDNVTVTDTSVNYISNCANIISDICTSERYGLGKWMQSANIDQLALQDFYDWCDELIEFKEYNKKTGLYETKTQKRYKINIALDKRHKSLDIINKLVSTCRGIPYWTGNKLKIAIDRPSTVYAQAFSMGNIVKDSYEETYIDRPDIPNQIEVQILDEDNDFKRASIVAVDKSRVAEAISSRKVELYGITNKARAKREAIFALKKAKGTKVFILFEAGIEAVVCEVGDLILFQHDVPQYGYGGRIVSVSGTEATIDREVALVAGTSYTLRIRKDDNTFEVCNFVAASTEITSVIDVGVTIDASCKARDIWQFGPNGIEAKPFRVMSMRKSSDNFIAISAAEYNVSVYDEDESIEIEEVKYSLLGNIETYMIDGSIPDPPAGDPSY